MTLKICMTPISCMKAHHIYIHCRDTSSHTNSYLSSLVIQIHRCTFAPCGPICRTTILSDSTLSQPNSGLLSVT